MGSACSADSSASTDKAPRAMPNDQDTKEGELHEATVVVPAAQHPNPMVPWQPPTVFPRAAGQNDTPGGTSLPARDELRHVGQASNSGSGQGTNSGSVSGAADLSDNSGDQFPASPPNYSVGSSLVQQPYNSGGVLSWSDIPSMRSGYGSLSGYHDGSPNGDGSTLISPLPSSEGRLAVSWPANTAANGTASESGLATNSNTSDLSIGKAFGYDFNAGMPVGEDGNMSCLTVDSGNSFMSPQRSVN